MLSAETVENKPRNYRRVVAYIRVSTDNQANSLDAQKRTIWSLADRQEVEVLDCPFVDEDVSGSTPVEKRPGLLAALEVLRPGDALVVAKRDRLARDLLVVAMIETLVTRKGGVIVSASGEGTEGDDPDAPEQFMFRKMVDLFAQYERLVIRSRTRAALASLRSRGRRTGTVPIGQSVEDDGGRSKTSDQPNKLGEDSREQAAIAKIVELHGRGSSPREIALELAVLEVKPRGLAKNWHHNTIRKILQARGVYRPQAIGGDRG